MRSGINILKISESSKQEIEFIENKLNAINDLPLKFQLLKDYASSNENSEITSWIEEQFKYLNNVGKAESKQIWNDLKRRIEERYYNNRKERAAQHELDELKKVKDDEKQENVVFGSDVSDLIYKLIEKGVITKKNGLPNFRTPEQAIVFFNLVHKKYDMPSYVNKYSKIISENAFIDGKKLKPQSIRAAKKRISSSNKYYVELTTDFPELS